MSLHNHHDEGVDLIAYILKVMMGAASFGIAVMSGLLVMYYAGVLPATVRVQAIVPILLMLSFFVLLVAFVYQSLTLRSVRGELTMLAEHLEAHDDY